MDYHGTMGNDAIDQRRDGIADGAVIYDGDGNDNITLVNGQADGGKGNDTITASRDGWAEALYWDSPADVIVDLGKGTAQDGFGTQDTLDGIHLVQGSPYDDTLIGGPGDDAFYAGGGSNIVRGGGGFDTVNYYFVPSTEAQVSYDATTDTFTVVKHFANGDHGTDVLSGVEKVEFTGGGSDGRVLLRTDYVGDLRTDGQSVQLPLPSGAAVSQFKVGDFNGDGHADLAVVTQVGTGTAAAPTWIYLGDGHGGFTDGTTALFGQTPMKTVGGGRTMVADFNGDGRSDLFQLDFGNDAPPFAGGINSEYLSTWDGRLVDASASLPQQPDTNHGGCAGDVDSDGDIDLVVNTLDRGNVLLLNDGHGNFTEQPGLLPHPSVSVGGVTRAATDTYSGLVDVDGDGDLDLILGTWDGNPAHEGSQILLNDGGGNFTKAAPIPLPASGIAGESFLDVKAIDLNGDACPDLMLSVTSGDTTNMFYHNAYIQLLVNDGTGHYRDETSIRLAQSMDGSAGGWIHSLTAVDFNHDGHPDILAESDQDTVTSKVYLNQGDGTFALDWQSVGGARAVAADVNEDGMTDLMTVGTDNVVSTWDNDLTNGHVYRANFGGDRLLGSSGADTFYASTGNDQFDGADGLDTAVFTDARAVYDVHVSGGIVQVAGQHGTATLAHIERADFGDGALAFDIAGTAGQAYRIYQAAFGRTPDTAGLGFWIAAMDQGASLDHVAAQFVASAEFSDTYGALDDKGFLTTIYHNVLHREADADGFTFWDNALANGLSRAQMVAQFSESAENQAQIIGMIANGIAYLPYH